MDQARFAEAIISRIATADIPEQWTGRQEGTDTRYAVVDDLLPEEWVHAIHDAFAAGAAHFDTRTSFRERKSTSTRFDELPRILRDITFAFQAPEVSSLIAEQIGIRGMSGDPTLYAGGLSMMRQGDFLNPHIDNSHEATRTWYRRVNLLYYVTPEWPLASGGNLELWNGDVTRPTTIHSRFNRLVLMETNRSSWHSVDPVLVDRARCCVSNYYFSPQSPTGDEYYHVTSFTGRPSQPLRRTIGRIDNRLRKFARTRLRISRKSDKGYQAKC